MATIGITTTTVELELNDDAAFAKWEAEMHHSFDHDFIDGPTVEEWERELEMAERERDYREEMREAQLTRNIAYTNDPTTWGGDEFPF